MSPPVPTCATVTPRLRSRSRTSWHKAVPTPWRCAEGDTATISRRPESPFVMFPDVAHDPGLFFCEGGEAVVVGVEEGRDFLVIVAFPVSVVVCEDLASQLTGQVLLKQRAERLDGEGDQGGQVGGVIVADVHSEHVLRECVRIELRGLVGPAARCGPKAAHSVAGASARETCAVHAVTVPESRPHIG